MASYTFIPNLASQVGGNATQVGWIVSSNALALVVSNFVFGQASDRWGRRIFLIVGLFLASVTSLAQVLGVTVGSLLVTRVLFGICTGIYQVPLISYQADSGGRLGLFSAYGSLGWAIAGILAGAAAQMGERWTGLNPLMPYWCTFLASSVCFFLAFLVSLMLPELPTRTASGPLFPREVLWRNRRVYVPVFMRHLGAQAIWAIFPLYLESLGASKLWIGILHFVNSGSQFIVMQLLDRFRQARTQMQWGILLSAVTFFAYGVVHNYLAVIPVQVLLGLSFSLMQVGSLVILSSDNTEKGAAIGVHNSAMNLANVLGSLWGGGVTHYGGYGVLMKSSALLAVMGFSLSFPGAGIHRHRDTEDTENLEIAGTSYAGKLKLQENSRAE
ncbi:MAG: MFS transporter [Armatimonadetes bacterium]|nr:MFS transporter [Armatimonadota bacterium]